MKETFNSIVTQMTNSKPGNYSLTKLGNFKLKNQDFDLKSPTF